MKICEISLPKTELEQRDHLDKCEEPRCCVCYYCENALISSAVDNLVASN